MTGRKRLGVLFPAEVAGEMLILRCGTEGNTRTGGCNYCFLGFIGLPFYPAANN